MSSTPTLRRLAIVAALAYSCFGFTAAAFGFAPPTLLRRAATTTMLRKDCSSVSRRAKSFAIILQSSSREEEIAKLEQQLRELKQQQQGQDESTTNNDATPPQASSVYSDKRKNVVNDRGVREILPGKGMILSEQDLVESQLLDNSSDGKGLGVIPAVAIGLVAAVGLFFFAQVPVGQEDYMRYSAASTTSSKTIDLGDLNMDISR
jgi:hypothetical protein